MNPKSKKGRKKIYATSDLVMLSGRVPNTSPIWKEEKNKRSEILRNALNLYYKIKDENIK